MLSEMSFRRVLAVVALAVVASGSATAATVRGRLEPPADGEALRLVSATGEVVRLVAGEGLERTLRDPQLAGRTWEIRGTRMDDGQIEVEKIFTVKSGELHRVTYYCEICHIITHEPGRCMCCQGDTDLREVPGE